MKRNQYLQIAMFLGIGIAMYSYGEYLNAVMVNPGPEDVIENLKIFLVTIIGLLITFLAPFFTD